MSLESPEKERRRPKQTLNVQTAIPNRNRPLFSHTAGRQRRSENQRPDVFTDSLNTSYVPTPSPTKNGLRQPSGAKPRQSVGAANGRMSGPAFRATADGTNGDKSPSVAASTRNRTLLPPRTIRGHTRETPRGSIRKPTPERAKTRTPSPRRGRTESIVSPSSSASSPPRGLAESYQRIEDEEFLAEQEEEMTDDMSFANGLLSEDQSPDIDQLRAQRRTESTFSMSQKASRIPSPTRHRGNPRQEVVMDQNIPTQNSDENSTTSFAQSVIDDDTFNKGFPQHARDEQRLKNALGSDTQPFKKARTAIRAGLTIENLQRKDASSQSSGSTLGSPTLSSKGSDPGLNIPREWGRKGRGDNRWLSRIDRNSGKFTGDISKARRVQDVSVSGSDGRRSSEPIVDWMTTASETPLPSIEGGSSQTDLRVSSSSRSTPIPNLRRQTSLSQIRERDANEDNPNDRSLQRPESPPLRIKSSALDQIREKEMETLEKSAVTTSRLGELREKRSLEQVRRRSPSIPDVPSRESRYSESPEKTRPKRPPSINEEALDQSDEDIARVRSRATLSRSPEKQSRQRSWAASIGEISNSRTSGSLLDPPIIIVKPEDPDAQSSSNGNKHEEISAKNHSQRPKHERQDSQDLLRRLARVTSPTSLDYGNKSNTYTAVKSDVSSKDNDVTPTPELTSIQPEKEHPQIIPISEIKDQGSGADDKLASPDNDHVASTPQNLKSNSYFKTPLVTGAWIDTPLPVGGRGLPAPTPSDITDEKDLGRGIDAVLVNQSVEEIPRKLENRQPEQLPPLASTAPVLPKSTLSNILEQAKLNAKKRSTQTTSYSSPYSRDNEDELDLDDTLQLNESTIQSLENLITHDTDVAALLTPPHSSSPPSPTPERPPLRSTEDTTSDIDNKLQPYDNMTSRLSKLGLSIRDAKNGIVGLERFMFPTNPSTTLTAPSTNQSNSLLSSSENECNQAGELHDFIWPCARCGSNVSGIPSTFARDTGHILGAEWQWQTIRLPVPKLWAWRRGTWWPTITGLGWCVLVSWALVFAERWVRCVM